MSAATLIASPSYRTLALGRHCGAPHRIDDPSFNLHRRDTCDGSRVLLAALQNRLRDIIAVSTSALGRMTRTHPVAAIVEDLAGKRGVRVLARAGCVLGMLGQQAMDSVPGLVIDDRVMKAFMDLALVGSRSYSMRKISQVRQRIPVRAHEALIDLDTGPASSMCCLAILADRLRAERRSEAQRSPARDRVAAHHSAILKPGWSASTREAAAFASSIRPSFPSAAARNMWDMLKPGLCWTDLRAAFVAS